MAPMPQLVYGLPGNCRARVAAGRAHSLIVTDDILSDDEDQPGLPQFTQLYTWGTGRNGRLGQARLW